MQKGKTPGSSLTLSYQRVAVYLSLIEFVEAFNKKSTKNVKNSDNSNLSRAKQVLNSITSAILPSLFSAAEKEKDEMLKWMAMKALALFLSYVQDKTQINGDFFKAGISNGTKSAYLTHYLFCLVVIASNSPETLEVFTPLSSILSAYIKELCQKKSVLGDIAGVFSLRLIVQFATFNKTCTDGISFAKIFSPGSFLCHPQMIKYMQPKRGGVNYFTEPDEEFKFPINFYVSESILSIFNVYLHNNSAPSSILSLSLSPLLPENFLQLLSTPTPTSSHHHSLLTLTDISPLDLLTAAILLGDHSLRMIAKEHMENFSRLYSKGQTNIIDYLLISLLSLLNAISFQEHQKKSTEFLVKSSEDDSAPDSTTSTASTNFEINNFLNPTKLQHVLKLIPVPKEPSPEYFICRLLLSCHPRVTSTTNLRAKGLWKATLLNYSSNTVLRNEDAKLQKIFYNFPLFTDQVKTMLTSIASNYLTNEINDLRTTVKNVLGLLLSMHGNVGYDFITSNIISLLLSILEDRNHSSFNDLDIDKFLNPSKYVKSTAASDIAVDEMEIKITNADRKGKRGKFGADFVEDEQWLEQIKKEKLKKLTEAKSIVKNEADELKKMEEESLMNQIKKSQICLVASIDVLNYCVDCDLKIISLHILRNVPTLLELIRNPLVSNQVQCLIKSIARRFSYIDAENVAASFYSVKIIKKLIKYL